MSAESDEKDAVLAFGTLDTRNRPTAADPNHDSRVATLRSQRVTVSRGKLGVDVRSAVVTVTTELTYDEVVIELSNCLWYL